MIPMKDHMALQIKKQDKLIISNRNQRTELNEEKHSTQREMNKSMLLQFSGSKTHLGNIFLTSSKLPALC